MLKIRKSFSVKSVLFLLILFVPSSAFCQAQTAYPVMTLADGTTVSMTHAQLTALASQQGITLSATPTITATQIAIPIPASLGGGFLVGEPAALAAALNAAQITTGATAATVTGATASAGTITGGASVSGLAGASGLGAGTIAAGAGAAAIAVGAAIASGSSGGGTTAHH